MRFPFTRLDKNVSNPARPLLPVQIDGLDQAIACLIDTGALYTRLPGWTADLIGIDLTDAPTQGIAVGGQAMTARQSHVVLTIAGVTLPSSVWFCEPWAQAFGLIGQEDVLRALRLVFSASEQWFELIEESAAR